MAQQMVNGSHYDGSTTFTNRMSKEYAVVNPPLQGKHKKPQDPEYRRQRHLKRMRRIAEEKKRRNDNGNA